MFLNTHTTFQIRHKNMNWVHTVLFKRMFHIKLHVSVNINNSIPCKLKMFHTFFRKSKYDFLNNNMPNLKLSNQFYFHYFSWRHYRPLRPNSITIKRVSRNRFLEKKRHFWRTDAQISIEEFKFRRTHRISLRYELFLWFHEIG